MPEKRVNQEKPGGRGVVIVLLLAIFVLFGAIVYVGMTGGGTAGLPPGSVGKPDPATGGSAGQSGREPVGQHDRDAGDASGPLTRDKAERDAIRRRILEAWARAGDEPVAAAARSGKIPPMPESPDGGIDPQYIREVVRRDLAPLIKDCYEEMLSRKDAGGRLVMSFKIVGDENIGGIVEEADVEAEGGLADEQLVTCIRESTLSIAFRPPPGDGWVTVKYPIELHPD